ncbi:MAG TPA: regulator, partial [Candidatus Dormibacteraeota bacterium]
MTTTAAPPDQPAAPPVQMPIWTPGDLNAFFGLGINLLVNVLVLGSLAAGVVHISGHDVNGVILPA